jgi:S-adenosylmethionine hydrolase
MRPIVALLSDFGSTDHYVGAMKGAVLAACPEATLVDLVHELPPHDVAAGARALAAAYRAFPGGTVFLAVVDPGVGGERRGLAATAGGYLFVGPDNGVLSPALERDDCRVRALTNAGLFRHVVSRTFHGRDVFAPVAGHLARGGALDEVGPVVVDAVCLPRAGAIVVAPDEWEGVVEAADRFGNLVTNVSEEDLAAMLATVAGDPTRLVVVAGGQVLPLVGTYAEVSPGVPCALVGSSARLELAVNRASATDQLAAGPGARVRVKALASFGGIGPPVL